MNGANDNDPLVAAMWLRLVAVGGIVIVDGVECVDRAVLAATLEETAAEIADEMREALAPLLDRNPAARAEFQAAQARINETIEAVRSPPRQH